MVLSTLQSRAGRWAEAGRLGRLRVVRVSRWSSPTTRSARLHSNGSTEVTWASRRE